MQVIKYLKPLSLQFLSVLIAFFLWFYVLSSAETKLDKKVTVHYVLPDEYAIINKVPHKITYSLVGPRALIRSLNKKDEHIKLNIANIYRDGELSYEFNIENLGIKFPFGTTIESIKPNTVSVELEKKMSKVVPIKLQSVGEIPSDHKLMQWSIVPNEIEISGPQSLIDSYVELKTSTIDLGEITQSGNKTIPIFSIDDRIELSHKVVDYQYEVQPTRANMMIKNIPIYFLSQKVIASSNRRNVNLMVLAENSINLDLKREQIKVIAEIPDDADGKVTVDLQVKLPKGLYLLEVMPKKIEVNIK